MPKDSERISGAAGREEGAPSALLSPAVTRTLWLAYKFAWTGALILAAFALYFGLKDFLTI